MKTLAAYGQMGISRSSARVRARVLGCAPVATWYETFTGTATNTPIVTDHMIKAHGRRLEEVASH